MNFKNNPTNLFLKNSSTIHVAFERMDATGQGVLLLIDDNMNFLRTVTDGDLRRLILTGAGLNSTLGKLPSLKPIILKKGTYTRRQALNLMSEHSINHIPIVDDLGAVVDLLDRKKLDDQILLSTPHLGDFEREYVEEAFRTNWIAPLGPNVDAFETEIATIVGAKHAAAVSSGTAAIHLALRLLNVGRDDVVFCSALTFVATANPIIYQGAEPVFIDSEPESWNMSPIALERALSDAKKNNKLPKAVLVVNLYGQTADMDLLTELCDHYRVPIIEDAAESLGGKYKGRPSGSMGKIGIYSFNGNKIITTSGGGMLVCNDEDMIKRARFLATQAREAVPHYEHTTVGYNYRMSNILAGVGRGQLRVLNDRVDARRKVFDTYKSALKNIEAIEWMTEPSWSYSNRWLTTGTIDPQKTDITSALLVKMLADELVEARPVWKPMQLQPVFSGTRYFEHAAGKSVSADLFNRGFCLPSGSNMLPKMQDRVIECLISIFKAK